MRRTCACVLVAALVAAACASEPAAPATGRGAAWGYLRLVPREGLPAASTSYSDRRLTGVELVDYARPGFAVVYDDTGAAPTGGPPARLTVRGAPKARLEPARAALAAGGTIEVVNETADAHVVSCPAAGLLRRLEPGASLAISAASAGEWAVFLLDAPREQARIFAAPGAWSVVSEAGRFELSDLPPGRRRLAAWHPRFPPAAATVDLAPGQVVRVDLELRVDRLEQEADAP